MKAFVGNLVRKTGALTAMLKGEPPSPRTAARIPMFRVGRDSRGHWVVEDQQGVRGGLFVDRAEALKFAMFENGDRPQAVIMVPGILELEIGGSPAPRSAVADTQVRLRRVARHKVGVAS
jgi:hypothetical protein